MSHDDSSDESRNLKPNYDLPTHQEAPEGFIYLGKFGRTFGLKGGLRFYPVGETEANIIAEIEDVFITSLGMRKLKFVNQKGPHLLIFIAGIKHLDYSKPIINQKLYAKEEDLPEVENSFYVDKLIGSPVFLNGEAFGEVKEAIDASGQELLVIATEEKDHMVPLGAGYVAFKEDGVYIVDPPEGLFDL